MKNIFRTLNKWLCAFSVRIIHVLFVDGTFSCIYSTLNLSIVKLNNGRHFAERKKNCKFSRA